MQLNHLQSTNAPKNINLKIPNFFSEGTYMRAKVFAGAAGGVAIPLVIEFGARGARISPQVPIKWSGAIGATVGVVTGVLPAVWANYPMTKDMKDEDKDATIAFGSAMFATGVGILLLDELRKRQAYTFKRELPLGVPEGNSREGLETPELPLVKEI